MFVKKIKSFIKNTQNCLKLKRIWLKTKYHCQKLNETQNNDKFCFQARTNSESFVKN